MKITTLTCQLISHHDFRIFEMGVRPKMKLQGKKDYFDQISESPTTILGDPLPLRFMGSMTLFREGVTPQNEITG